MELGVYQGVQRFKSTFKLQRIKSTFKLQCFRSNREYLNKAFLGSGLGTGNRCLFILVKNYAEMIILQVYDTLTGDED